MATIKLIHILCAYATGIGFALRGVLAVTNSDRLDSKLVKKLPHIIDTFLLASGVTMMVSWSFWPTSQPWLAAKIIALLVYIGFGLLMLRWGHDTKRKWIGFAGGLLIYVYIVGVAHSKNVLSIFGLV